MGEEIHIYGWIYRPWYRFQGAKLSRREGAYGEVEI